MSTLSHWVAAPVVLPLLAALAIVLVSPLGQRFQRAISIGSAIALLLVNLGLALTAASGAFQVYEFGSWPAPFGIVLVLDGLSALMLSLTSVVALCSILYSVNGADTLGRHFHALFHLQLVGLNGAFLTGDLFNLFVFFEILLIASYALLLYGANNERLRAGLHYVIYNLTGSALFIVAVAVIYGLTGTLNMADLAVKVPLLGEEDAALIRAGAALLLVVFAVKAALLPLYFWLPNAYSAAVAPVAALFAIMTKVGVYSILRVYTLIFGPQAGIAADIAAPWLLPLALATLLLGGLGALSSAGLRRLIAYLVIASVGMLLAAIGLFSAQAITAALFYMVHTTLITAGLFLLADVIARQRADVADGLRPAPPVTQIALLGLVFLLGAMAVVGLPPLSGFIGKVLVLQAAADTEAQFWVWAVVLFGGFLALVTLSRAGSALFWKTDDAAPASGSRPRAGFAMMLPVILLLGFSVVLSVAARPLMGFTGTVAAQLTDPNRYIENVLRPEVRGRAAALRAGTRQ